MTAGEQLHDLELEISSCAHCDCYKTATQSVPGEGPVDAAIMLVGEAPGFNEDKSGRPFVGAAGRLLDGTLLPLAGLNRSDVYITNILKHRPPNNRDPLPEEIIACRGWLDRQVEIIAPRLLVTMGRFSLAAFFPGEMISRVHGQTRRKDGRYYFNMYHPAAALHQQNLAETIQRDMRKLGEFLAGPEWKQGVAEAARVDQLALF